MSTDYSGVASNITRHEATPTKNIASSTNASPIEVTTSSAHSLTEGDRVWVTGHQTNTNANGIWTVHVVTTTKFTLVGSTGNGVGGATGTMAYLNAEPTLTLMEDLVDDLDAANLNPPRQNLADKAQWLVERTGEYRLVHEDIGAYISNEAATQVMAAWSTKSVDNASWQHNSDAKYSQTLDVIPTDVIDCEFATMVDATAGGLTAFRLFYSVENYGVADPGPLYQCAGVGLWAGVAAVTPLVLHARIQAPNFGASKGYQLRLYLMARSGGAGPATPYSLCGDHGWLVRVYRHNGSA